MESFVPDGATLLGLMMLCCCLRSLGFSRERGLPQLCLFSKEHGSRHGILGQNLSFRSSLLHLPAYCVLGLSQPGSSPPLGLH